MALILPGPLQERRPLSVCSRKSSRPSALIRSETNAARVIVAVIIPSDGVIKYPSKNCYDFQKGFCSRGEQCHYKQLSRN